MWTFSRNRPRKFKPSVIAVFREDAAKELKERLKDMNIRIVTGMDGLIEIATLPETDILVTAIVGMIGILPTIEAIKAGKDIALANKETLVTAGHIIMPLAERMGVQILPVDSEHSAIFQALHGEDRRGIEKILTDSLRRSLPGKKAGGTGECSGGGRPEASELVHGPEDHDRFCHHGK